MSARFRLLSYRTSDGEVRSGLAVGEEAHDIATSLGEPGLATMRAVLEAWDVNWPALKAFATTPRPGGLGEVRGLDLVAPLPDPGAIFCAAANFRDHMQAMATKLGIPPEPDPHDLDVSPYHFLKPTRQTIVGPGATVALPPYARNVDWEIELVAVIGRTARDVAAGDALGHVAGYTVGNDLSVRDRAFMKRPNVPDGSLFRTDFLGMKGFEGSCPIGPWIVPADALPDPQTLGMKLSVDDALRQDSSTGAMVFTVAEQIANLSRHMPLYPGDIILTGTPAGTGAESDTFLRSGQTVTAWIEGIGELVTRIA